MAGGICGVIPVKMGLLTITNHGKARAQTSGSHCSNSIY